VAPDVAHFFGIAFGDPSNASYNYYWKIVADAQSNITIDGTNLYSSDVNIGQGVHFIWLENIEIEHSAEGAGAGSSGIDAHTGDTSTITDIMLKNLYIHNNGLPTTFPDPHGIYVFGRRIVVDGGLYANNGRTNLQNSAGIQMFGAGCFVASDSDPTCQQDNVIKNAVIFDNGPGGGIYISQGLRFQVFNNIIYSPGVPSPHSAGIVMNFRVADSLVANNTFYSNANGGIDIDSSGTNNVLRNNILYLNGSAINDSGTGSTISNNLIDTNPLFVSAGTGNFNLQAGSPAQSYGMNLTSLLIAGLDVDFYGAARVTSGAWDAGAINLTVTSCTPYQLFFTGQPSSAYVRATLGTVAVEVRDVGGNLCSATTNAVTLAGSGGNTWTALVSSSSLTKNASSGTATWTDLYVTPTAGNGSITASSSGLVSSTSNSITITAASFTSSPPSATQGTTAVLTMSGTATAWVNATTVLTVSGTGVTVNSTTCANSTTCIASITLDVAATTGGRTLTLTTGSLVDTLPSGLVVVPLVPPAPSLGAGARIRANVR
jgi:hypothetical protein